MANSRYRLAFGDLSMTCLADATLRWWLSQFDLDIINALQLQKSLPRPTDDLVALILSESRQVQPDHCPGWCHAHLIKPTQIQKGTVTAGIAEVAERLSGLFRGGHASPSLAGS